MSKKILRLVKHEDEDEQESQYPQEWIEEDEDDDKKECAEEKALDEEEWDARHPQTLPLDEPNNEVIENRVWSKKRKVLRAKFANRKMQKANPFFPRIESMCDCYDPDCAACLAFVEAVSVVGFVHGANFCVKTEKCNNVTKKE